MFNHVSVCSACVPADSQEIMRAGVTYPEILMAVLFADGR